MGKTWGTFWNEKKKTKKKLLHHIDFLPLFSPSLFLPNFFFQYTDKALIFNYLWVWVVQQKQQQKQKMSCFVVFFFNSSCIPSTLCATWCFRAHKVQNNFKRMTNIWGPVRIFVLMNKYLSGAAHTRGLYSSTSYFFSSLFSVFFYFVSPIFVVALVNLFISTLWPIIFPVKNKIDKLHGHQTWGVVLENFSYFAFA